MPGAKAAVEPSGATGGGFVRVVTPPHRAGLCIAQTTLPQGNDPQMRRWAQEILPDQTIGDSVDAALAITARSAKMTPALKGTRRTNMKIVRWCQMFCLLSASAAQQAPWGRPDITVSSHDRDRFTAPHFALNG